MKEVKVYKNLDLYDLDGEVWKVIKDFKDYSVSNLGRVKSFKRYKHGKILRQYKHEEYLRIDLYKNEKIKLLVHRIVYETFKEKLEEGYDAHHINEDKENNYIENLEAKEHSKHIGYHNKGKIISETTRTKISESRKGKSSHSKETKKKISEKMKGKNNPSCILTEEQVIQIKLLLKEGILTQYEISKLFGVSNRTVSNIKTGRTWCHIKLENI